MAHQGSKPGQKCQTSSKRKMGQRNEESASETPREDIHTPSSQAQGEPSEPRSAQAPDTKRARTHERRDYSERATAPPPDPVLRSQGSFPSRSVFSDSSRRDEPTLWVPVVSSYGQAYLPEEEATRLVPDIDAQPCAPLPRKPEGRAHSEPASTSASGPAPETGEKPAIATEAPVGPTASPVTEHKSSSQQDDGPDVLPNVDSQAAETNEEMPWLPSGPEVAGTRQAKPLQRTLFQCKSTATSTALHHTPCPSRATPRIHTTILLLSPRLLGSLHPRSRHHRRPHLRSLHRHSLHRHSLRPPQRLREAPRSPRCRWARVQQGQRQRRTKTLRTGGHLSASISQQVRMLTVCTRLT